MQKKWCSSLGQRCRKNGNHHYEHLAKSGNHPYEGDAKKMVIILWKRHAEKLRIIIWKI
jgi:hypothetical protein